MGLNSNSAFSQLPSPGLRLLVSLILSLSHRNACYIGGKDRVCSQDTLLIKKKRYQVNPLITNVITERKARESATLALDFSSPLTCNQALLNTSVTEYKKL